MVAPYWKGRIGVLTTTDNRQLYASPQDDTQTAFLNFIQTAEKQVLIADYSFNLIQLETILPTLKSRGVEVRLALDRSQSRGKTEKGVIAELQSAGIDMVIGTSSKHQIMHDKFAVIDTRTIYGSWNFTKNASAEDNFFIIDPNPQVSAWFASVWNNIYDWIKANEPQTN